MLRFIRDFRAWLAFIGLLMSAPVCLGQFSGSIQGTVVDPSGATVPNAKLTLTNTATQVTSEAASGYKRQLSLCTFGTWRL
ncbi:MAG TPA: carboxypeptidase-like regulatory domain-containing protein [Bryobacteraceae bacterium]